MKLIGTRVGEKQEGLTLKWFQPTFQGRSSNECGKKKKKFSEITKGMTVQFKQGLF